MNRNSYSVGVSWIALMAAVNTVPTFSAWAADETSKSTASDTKLPASCDGVAITETLSAEDSASVAQCSIKQAVIHIRELRNEYQGYKEANGKVHPGKLVIKSRWQTTLDSSVIGLGIATVGAAVFHAPTGAIAGLALSGNGLSEYRGYYNIQSQQNAYVTALKATRCVASSAEPFFSESPTVLWNAMASLQKAIANVQATEAQVSNAALGVSLSPSLSTAVSNALTAANTALDAANKEFSALEDEAGAYNQAVSTIDGAHDAIKGFIEGKLERQGIDYNTAVASLSTAISSTVASQIKSQAAMTAQGVALQAQGANQATAGHVSVGVAPSPNQPTQVLGVAQSGTVTGEVAAGATITYSLSTSAALPSVGDLVKLPSVTGVQLTDATVNNAIVLSTSLNTSIAGARANIAQVKSATLSTATLSNATLSNAALSSPTISVTSVAGNVVTGKLSGMSPMTASLSTATFTSRGAEAPPSSLQAAQNPAAPGPAPSLSTSLTTALTQNETAVANLLAAVAAAALPNPKYTSLLTTISTCTSPLSS